MVIADYLRDKLNEKPRADAVKRKAEEEKCITAAVAEAMEITRAEAMDAARAEARDVRNSAVVQTHQVWADWNRMRMEADEKGEPFDETPPEIPSDIN